MIKRMSRKEGRALRHRRVRRKIQGTAERPRMAVMISNRRIYVQFVDDDQGRTLAAVASPKESRSPTVALAKELGIKAAEAARARGITTVVFDRGGFRYHGRIKALADAAREAGLTF